MYMGTFNYTYMNTIVFMLVANRAVFGHSWIPTYMHIYTHMQFAFLCGAHGERPKVARRLGHTLVEHLASMGLAVGAHRPNNVAIANAAANASTCESNIVF